MLKNKFKKVYLIPIVLILLIVGLYIGHRDYWWFTPAYSSRQTVSKFFTLVTKGKTEQAYALLSPTSQAKMSYADFESSYDTFSGGKITIKYYAYKSNSRLTAISGLVKNNQDYTVNFNVAIEKVAGQNRLVGLTTVSLNG